MLSWTISVSSRFDQSDWTGVDIGEGLGLGLGRDKGPGWGSEDLFGYIGRFLGKGLCQWTSNNSAPSEESG